MSGTTYQFGRRIGVLILVLSAAVVLAQTEPSTPPTAPQQSRDAGGVVTITDASASVLLRYTLDGSAPSSKSGQYPPPIDLPQGGLVKVRAFTLDGKAASGVVETKWPPLPGSKPLPSTLVPVTQERSAPHYIWAERHRAVCALMKKRQPQVIFIGDSITHFWGGEPSDMQPIGGTIWAREYEKYNALDLGFGWDRTENVLWRLNAGNLMEPRRKWLS